MRRILNFLRSLPGIATLIIFVLALAFIFRSRSERPMALQQAVGEGLPTSAPMATPMPIPTPTVVPPTPTMPATPVAMETYISKTLIVANVGSGPGEIGVFEIPEMRPVVPASIALDKEGSLYISDNHNRRVIKYDSEGNFVATIILQPQMSVRDIRVGNDGTIYLLEGGGDFVRRINQNGELLLEYPKPHRVESLISFRLDDVDMLWVEVVVKSEFPSHHAVVPIGNAQEVFSRQRQLDGTLAGYPLGDMVFAQGRMSDNGTEMQLFDQNGNLAMKLGPLDPKMITLDTEVDKSGNLYFLRCELIERIPFEVSKFNRKGNLIARFLVPAPYVPPARQIAIDDAENVYYLLPQKDQVQVIKLEKQ